MDEMILQGLGLAYLIVGIVSIVAYWPIIRDLYSKKRQANILSYALWTVSTGITFLYSYFVLTDLIVKLIVGLHFLACSTIMLLSINARQRLSIHKKRLLHVITNLF